MIYLIGGAPRCGKTSVARALAKRTHAPWFPADYLTAVVRQYIPAEDLAARLPLREVRQQDSSTDYLYSKYSADEIVRMYEVQAETAWPGIEAFIKYAVREKQDFILEGYQIAPTFLSRLGAEVRQNVRAIFLYKQDVAAIAEGLRNSTRPGDWLTANTKEDSTFTKVAEMMKRYGEKTRAEATEHDASVFCMDGDFEERTEAAVSALLQSK